MDKDQVIRAVDEALKRVEAAAPYYEAELEASGVPSDRYEPIFFFKHSHPIRDVLADCEEFAEGRNIMICYGSGARAVSPQWAANFILRQAINVGPSNAVDNYERIMSLKESEIMLIMALRGVSAEKDICLTENVKLVPISSLPPSKHKEMLENPHIVNSQRGIFPKPRMPLGNQQAALVMTFLVSPIFKDANEKDGGSAYFDAYGLLGDIMSCLTVVGPSCPMQEMSWTQYSDEILDAASNASSGSSYSIPEITPFALPVSPPIEEENARPVIESYLNLDGDSRTKIGVALHRLNQAMRRGEAGEKALDLCIALECLLVDDPGEHTHKVSTRSAIITKNTLEERVRAKNIIKHTYALRSKVVHSGVAGDGTYRVVAGEEKIDANQLTDKAIELTVELAKKLISRGGVDDWGEFDLLGGRDAEEN